MVCSQGLPPDSPSWSPPGAELLLGRLERAEFFGLTGFASRARAVEDLELHVLDRLRWQGARLTPSQQALAARAESLRRRLEAQNARQVLTLRRQVRRGELTQETLKQALLLSAGLPGPEGAYDALDLLVASLLGGSGREALPLEPEMVAFQPTPARAILQLLERCALGPEDTLIDLGAGLGHVVILAALLSEARARGVERDPALCAAARRSARLLGAARAQFEEADARTARLSDGTVFFLYTPFRGAMLQEVLGRLQAEARTRPIRVCTYGPCTAEVARAGWLRGGGPDPAVFLSA